MFKEIIDWSVGFVIAIVIFGLFYLMFVCFAVGLGLNPDNCYNFVTGEVTICETGDNVGFYIVGPWQSGGD